MTRDDIIRMAREACETTSWKPGLGNEHVVEFMARFAALVTAAEREACAKVCDKLGDHEAGDSCEAMYRCASAIRARGNT
jgi:hypothetical protein